jgi:hypothetical protein
MSWSLSASGHIAQQEAVDGDTEPQAPEQIEAELAVKLHELLSQPKYGCSFATLYGQFTGHVNLSAVTSEPVTAASDDQADEDQSEALT